MDGKAILSGDVYHFRLPEILQLLSFQGLTGRLSLMKSGEQVDIYVRDGGIAFATGEKRGSREQIGSLLVSMGRLKQEDLDAALSASIPAGERLGEALVKGALVKPDDIRAALLKQTERSVYKAMAWGEGRFSFEPCGMPQFVEAAPISLPVDGLILEGVRRIGEARLISEKIPSLEVVFVRSPLPANEVERMRLTDDEAMVLGLVDGKADVKKLLEASGMGEFRLLKVVYALYSAGIIRKKEPARSLKTQYL